MFPEFISRTRYYYKTWTWVKRFGILFIIFIYAANAVLSARGNYALIPAGIGLFIAIGFILSPIDDIAYDAKYFYHLRTSLIRKKITSYEIAKIKAIRCLGVHVPGISVGEVASRRTGASYTNTIEMVFKDDTSKSIEVGIYKVELIWYMDEVRSRLNK